MIEVGMRNTQIMRKFDICTVASSDQTLIMRYGFSLNQSPHNQLIVLNNEGHLLHLIAPDEVSFASKRFISDVAI
jgi:hypothetical protein